MLGEKNWSGIGGPAVAWSLLLLLAGDGGGARARTGDEANCGEGRWGPGKSRDF
jgi:hypothetical protein